MLAFRLGPGPADGQYAAAAYPLTGDDQFDTVTMTIRASAPMRASLQLRVPGGEEGAAYEARWQQSVYVDTEPRTVTLRLQDLEVVEPSAETTLDVARARSLLLVVDTWHTRPGAQGQIWITRASLGTTAAGITSAR